MNRFTKLTIKILLWVIGGVIGLILLAFVLIRIPAVQNFAVQKVVNYLENKIGTKVTLEYISLDLPKLLVLEGVYFEDQKQDTLFAGETLKVDISLLKLLNNKVEINELDFRGITAHVVRSLPDSAYNFDYIIRAFVTEDTQSESDTSAAMAFSIDKINLDRVKIIYKDDVIGTSATLDLNHADTRIKTFDLAKMYFEIPKITINGLTTVVKQWEVADATDIPSTSALGVEQVVDEDQPTDIRIGKLDLKNFDVQYDDVVAAMNANVIFKTLQLDFNELNLPEEIVDIKKIILEDTDASVTFAKGQKEPDTSSISEPLNWVVKANSIELKRNHIVYDDNNSPVL
ncbi:MAG TPA: AsmA family protein, partial [Sphingobacteriaceae bacterium]|nr:AsmA family protein [Sphingobacteriaceae bacterium]